MIRPKGMPRDEWNALSQKQQAKLCAKHGVKAVTPAEKSKANQKKWYLGVETPWGNLNAGSGDKKGRSQPARNPTISMAPVDVGVDKSATRLQVVEQDEFISTVQGSTTFACSGYQTQPGSSTFPWLSGIARLYQRYRIRKWEYYYKPTVTEYNTLGSQGKIVLSHDYDAATTSLTSLQQAEGMEPHADALPCQGIILALEPSRCNPSDGKFVRTTLPPAGTDIKTYDAGRLLICTEGMSGAGQIGELRVRYAVELINPIINNVASAPINAVASVAQSTTVLVSNVPGTAAYSSFSSPIGNGLNLTANGTGIVMRAGLYQISLSSVFTNTGSCSYWRHYCDLDGVAILGADASCGTNPATFGALTNGLAHTFLVQCAEGQILSSKSFMVFSSGTTTSVNTIMIALA